MTITTIPVRHPSGEYPILIGSGLLHELGSQVRSRNQAAYAALVTNPTVDEHYGQFASRKLAAAGFETVRCLIPDGEQYKTLEQIDTLYHHFVQGGMDRHSPVIALGGGVIGDMAGFAAATYLRGLPFFQVPTTLLSMVDASVGGKVGVDLPAGKNLVGAFKQPEAVLIDPDVLETLTPSVLAQGMAEVIKHAIIADPELFQHLERNGTADIGWIIERAVRVKVNIVQEDPYERGRRAVLNLGHTFAHALEQVSQYQISHGYAVALGLVAAAHASLAMNRTDPFFVGRLTGLIDQLDLPVRGPDMEPKLVRQAMNTDKKRVGQRLRFILPVDVGHVEIADDVSEKAIEAALLAILPAYA